ncbi:MAG: TIGR02281 family clan AA aspartic protease [Phenylobacterium sp.]|uniref:TIGR02281 family clan AA aspartic protease n=1 Tax=Phenylobacterium sp. TaxID=1871053 RepID=UPI00271F570C|nr:TIGR02281 family clan AA aspartic protease [Phenylobacterium sp.]MDO8899930.1 TIGR02281 family clan AA aspartic protease [Phenylobacterium sp.]MDP2215660.1 TIGR02281 family clan AA aspartic protease [Phenylobacterium sp.]
MLKFAMLTLVAAVSAVGAAQTVVALDPSRGASALVATLREAPPPMAVGQSAAISKASDGHYWAEADVNGARVRFLVDTGATAVALTLEDAQRLGFDPAKLDYRQKVMTASGEARAAVVKLSAISVAGARVADVDALVIEKGLETSLLGMSYLGRLTRFEATRTSLILRP